jgi:hypothetical protein
LWPEDGAWYKGTVSAITIDGIGVTFSEYGNVSTVAPDQVRPRKATDVIVVGMFNFK